MPKVIRKPFEVLREIQSQLDKLEANFNRERAALESKYRTMCQPLYAKRHDILNGDLEVEEEDKTTEGVPEFLSTAIKNNKEDDDDDFKEVNLHNYDIGDSLSKAPKKASTSLEYDSKKKQKDTKLVEFVGETIKPAVVGILDEIRDLAMCLSRGIEIGTKQMRYNVEIIEKQLKSAKEISEKQRRLIEKLNDTTILSSDDRHRASYLIGKSDSLINVFYSIPDSEKSYWVHTLLRGEKKYRVNTLLRGEK